MLTLDFHPFPLLSTHRLLLREVVPSDVNEVFVQRSHPEIRKYVQKPAAKNVDEASAFIEKIALQKNNKEAIHWAITLSGQDKLIGSVCLWNINSRDQKAELGYSLHPDYFGKGIMNETLKAILAYGYTRMGLKMIDAYTRKNNLPSINLLERQGFKRNLLFEKEHVSREELEYNVVYTHLNPSY